MAEMDLNQDKTSVPDKGVHRTSDSALGKVASMSPCPCPHMALHECLQVLLNTGSGGCWEVSWGNRGTKPARITCSLRALQSVEPAPGQAQHPPVEFGIWGSAKGSRGAAAPGAPRCFTRLRPWPQGKILVSMAAGPASPDVQISIRNKSFSTC